MPVLPLVGSRMMVSGPSLPAAFGRLDHAQPDAILDAAAGLKNSSLVTRNPEMGDGCVGMSNRGWALARNS
jgi:hypothetical protein